MKFIFSIFFTGMALMLFGQNSNNIQVYVSNISSNEGQILAKLYNSKETFRKEIFRIEKVGIQNNMAKLSFGNIENGTYAIAIIHDENGNGKMDFGLIGIPKEPVASSNNAKGFFGPPDFEDSKFEVNNIDVIQRIKM